MAFYSSAVPCGGKAGKGGMMRQRGRSLPPPSRRGSPPPCPNTAEMALRRAERSPERRVRQRVGPSPRWVPGPPTDMVAAEELTILVRGGAGAATATEMRDAQLGRGQPSRRAPFPTPSSSCTGTPWIQAALQAAVAEQEDQRSHLAAVTEEVLRLRRRLAVMEEKEEQAARAEEAPAWARRLLEPRETASEGANPLSAELRFEGRNQQKIL